MIQYDKGKIRESLTHDNIFDLLQEFGGDPERTDFGIVSATICHNAPGEGSRKLYYYNNTGLFKCYTGCDDIFDPFDLVIKVMKIQKGKEFTLVDAMRFISFRFKLTEVEVFDESDDLTNTLYNELSVLETIEEIRVFIKTLFDYLINIDM